MKRNRIKNLKEKKRKILLIEKSVSTYITIHLFAILKKPTGNTATIKFRSLS